MTLHPFRISLALAAAVTLGCAAVTLPDLTPTSVSPLALGARDRRVVEQVVLVTDASGTMYASKTFPEAKALTRSFIAGLPGGAYEASLTGFGGTDRQGTALTRFDRNSLANAAANLSILGDYSGYGGETPYRNVFAEIGQSLEGKSGRAAVVLFSDGLPDYQARAVAAAKALSEARGGQICFHAVQTGNDELGTQNLEEIAAQFSCGTMRNASTLGSAANLRAFVHDVMAETSAAPPPPPPPMAMTDACTGVIRLRGIRFGFDKAAIDETSSVVLDIAADQLKQCPNITVRIDGHTDSTGPEQYNLGLSRKRAEAVKGYFVDHGVSAARLSTRGLGESAPIADNSTRDGRAHNRRVEMTPTR